MRSCFSCLKTSWGENLNSGCEFLRRIFWPNNEIFTKEARMPPYRNMSFLVCIFCLLLTLKSSDAICAPQLLFPRSLHETKIVARQKAYRVKGAEIFWINEAAIRRDFNLPASMTTAEITVWILREFAVITERQLALRGLLTSDFDIESDQTVLFHGPTDSRTGTKEVFGPEGEKLGLIDLKGSGLGVFGVPPERLYSIVLSLRDETAFQKLDFQELNKLIELYKTRIAFILDRRENADNDLTQKTCDRSEKINRKILALLEQVKKAFSERLIGIETTSLGSLLQDFRRLDYLNGSFSLAHAVSSTVRRHAADQILSRTPSPKPEHATRVVDDYFIIRLPYSVTEDGIHWEAASILGRQPSWRSGRAYSITVDTEVFDDIGDFQGTDTGAWTDFERVTIRHPQVSSLLAYDIEFVGHIRMIISDLEQNPGDRTSSQAEVDKLISDYVSNMDRAGTSASPDDRESSWSAVVRSFSTDFADFSSTTVEPTDRRLLTGCILYYAQIFCKSHHQHIALSRLAEIFDFGNSRQLKILARIFRNPGGAQRSMLLTAVMRLLFSRSDLEALLIHWPKRWRSFRFDLVKEFIRSSLARDQQHTRVLENFFSWYYDLLQLEVSQKEIEEFGAFLKKNRFVLYQSEKTHCAESLSRLNWSAEEG